MFLYNVVLGNQQLTPDTWTHITDSYGNHFIAKEDIRQRIRIDGKVDSSIYPELGELTPEWSASNMQCYNILPGTRWANNNRNMNPILIANKDTTKEQIVVYITVSNNYTITRFNTKHKILQTYHKKNIFQGCAVILTNEDKEKNNNIISINVYDNRRQQYAVFNITFTDDNKIFVDRKTITNKETRKAMEEQIAKFSNRYMGFKIITKPNDLLTLTYVTSDKFKDDIVKATKDINKPRIITINPEQLEDPNNMDSIIQMLEKEFENGRIKAITQCGVNLPLDLIRRFKILYVFNYDTKNNILSCRKSN